MATARKTTAKTSTKAAATKKPSASAVDPAVLAAYGKLIAEHGKAEKKGATMPYTSVNGHMFSFIANTGKLALRLPEAEREDFIEKFNTSLCEQHGTVLKEYVVCPDAVVHDRRTLKKYYEISFDYVAALKPKPTTRKKSKSTVAKSKATIAGRRRGV